MSTAAVPDVTEAKGLEGRPAEAILAWAAAQYAPRVTFATGFGAEGCVLIDMIGRLQLPIDLFTLDTGLLFPETYALWERLETRYGIVIRAVRPRQSVEEQGRIHGDRLWEREPDACCKLRKVEPLRQELTGFDAWIAAIRRDQTPDRAAAHVLEADPRFGLLKINPLVAWTSGDVAEYVRRNDVPVNSLHAEGYPSIGCMPCTSRVLTGEDPRAGRWRGRVKTECGLHARPERPQISSSSHPS